jgi:hypothetical protein
VHKVIVKMLHKSPVKKVVPAHLVPVETLCQNIVLSHHLLSDALREMRNEIAALSRRFNDMVLHFQRIDEELCKRAMAKKKQAVKPRKPARS